MSEINTLYNKNSKQLLSLALTLKENGKALEGRVAESLLIKRNMETIKKRKLKNKFAKHPHQLSSGSETSLVHQPVIYGYSDSTLSHNYSKSCDISAAHSEHSTFTSNFNKRGKSRPISLSSYSNSLLEHPINVNTDTVLENIPSKEMSQGSAISKQHTVSTKLRPKTTVNKSDAKKNAAQKKNVDYKLRNYLQRIICIVEDIRTTMVKGMEPPDGVEDWERVKVRTTEFAARFSRNYLYPLGRQICELEEAARQSGKLTNRTVKTFHQKLFTTHHTVFQAFQAYRSHMPTLLANPLPEKLQNVIEHTHVLCEIHLKFVNLDQTGSSRREALIEVLTNRCNILSDKLQEIIEKKNQMSMGIYSPNSKLSLMGYNVNFKKSVKVKPRKKSILEARLSMYSIPASIRTKGWKRTVENLAKDKLRYNHVQSRYKTAGYKHRAPPQKTSDQPKPKVFDKRSSVLLRNTPIGTPNNEDNILTMVEIQKDKDGITKHLPHIPQNYNKIEEVTDCTEKNDLQLNGLGTQIQGFCQKVCSKDGETMTQKNLEILLHGLLGMALDGKINNNETGPKKNGYHNNEVTQESAEPKQIDEEAPPESDKVVENKKTLRLLKPLPPLRRLEVPQEDTTEKNHKVEFNEVNLVNTKKFEKGFMTKNKLKRRQTVTVSGAKNAQLICIRDEDSIVESPDSTKSSPTVNHVNESGKSSQEAHWEPSISNAQGDFRNNIKYIYFNAAANKTKPKEGCLARSPKIKISRLPKKPLKKLEMVSKPQALKVIQYKLLYSKFTRNNPMYKRAEKIQPWELVDIVSDHLLLDLLRSVAVEMEVGKLLRSLYQSEFQ